MAVLKADSPLCRRIVLSFLDFLDSVELASAGDGESLEVAKDCLSEVFKIDSSSIGSGPKPDSLVEIFGSRTGREEIKLDQIHEGIRADTPCTFVTDNAGKTQTPGTSQSLGDHGNQDTQTLGAQEDELFGQFFGALEKVRYFGRDDEQSQLDRATNLFHNALMEMKKSGCEEFDKKNLAEAFKSQGNKAMQSKLYSEAIELYTLAIALCDDNAVYYCNRAAAYTQTNQYFEAICDCYKSIGINPNYSKAYSRLGFAYYALGNYRDALSKGFSKALLLDPSNESVKKNIKVAEEKLIEQQQRAERNQNGSSSSSGEPPRVLPMPFNVDMLRNMATNVFPDGGGIRVGGNMNVNMNGNEMPEEVFGALRSMMHMFSDGAATSRDNLNGGSAPPPPPPPP